MTERRPNEPIGPSYTYGTHVARYGLIDRVRWSAVIAGLVTALATMVVLSWLGVAIGLTAYDVGDRAQPFQTGAGIWAIISGIISFFLGGWVASRTAVATGDSGALNGTMVWCAAIPLMLLLFSGTLFSAARSAASNPDVSSRVIKAASNMPGAETGVPETQPSGTVSREDAQHAKSTAAKGAWWTLVGLLVGLGASALGGYAGQRGTHYEERTTLPPPTSTP